MMHQKKGHVIFAAVIGCLITVLGYISLGVIPAMLFFVGYLSGFVLWLAVNHTSDFSSIRSLYWITFALFIGHRVEEKVAGFFDVLAQMTGVPKPAIVSVPVIALLVCSVGAWLYGPVLATRDHPIGKFLIWTFFASMGITELAHFIFPFFTGQPYAYFPGMISVVVLAPAAWYGMFKFSKPKLT